jgi:hypothetical protein
MRVPHVNINIIVNFKFGALDGSHLATESLGHVKRKTTCLEKTLNRVRLLISEISNEVSGTDLGFPRREAEV